MPAPVGLARERLSQLLAPLWQRRLGLVVAPAGSGKTTLLAQFAAGAHDAPVAWYRAEPADGDPRALLACLERALVAAVPAVTSGWDSVEAAAEALEQVGRVRALLLIDDLHALHGTPAEAALERLLHYAPQGLAVLAATRAAPGFNLSRMRVAGDLVEIGPDDLRFRPWEVERLFRDVYREPLTPDELGELTRRTEGWAAGLQLFHLATEGRRHDERRRVLASLNIPARTVREYLATNVVDQLPEHLREFLVDTCVLGRLSGPLCDAYLGRSGSAAILDELSRRQIFTSALDADGWYRYHEVLRSHLQTILVERAGEDATRARHRRAGVALEEWGALHDALVAYCRGEDWDAVARLVGHEGEQLAHDPGGWLDLLPPALLQQDPWVLLATARRWRTAGRWEEATTAYRRAETAFADRAARALCRRERLAVSAWQEPVLVPGADWAGIVRAAVARDPLAARTQALALDSTAGRLAAGVAELLAGHCAQARQTLDEAATAEDASPLMAVGARIARAAAGLLAGDPEAVAEAESAGEEADRLGAGWLAQVARALLTLANQPGARSETASLRLAAERTGDPWGRHLAALLDGLAGSAQGPVRANRLEEAAEGFAALGAGVLEAWAGSALALALAETGDAAAPGVAREADARARAIGVPGARLLALRALAVAEPDANHGTLLASLGVECGLQQLGGDELAATTASADGTALRSFGGFRLELGGETLDLSGVRPRARAVLRLLGLQAGRSVHREVILEALWPESDLERGTSHLHVAVSTLRRVLPGAIRILRDGDAYRLVLPDGAAVDTDEFEHAVARGRKALALGDAAGAVAALERALDLHTGDLLPEDGPAEWVLGPREHHRSAAVQAAQDLADLQLERGAALKAAAACEAGLRIDRYRDGLWRTLVAAYDAAGDRAAAAHARQRYDEVLTALGLEPLAPAVTRRRTAAASS